jgi:superfamily II DNA or RNA helicase
VKFELFDYQADAADKLSKHLVHAAREYADDPAEQAAVVLAAPTGAGKTVIATAVVEASLGGVETMPGIEDATFLWVTDDPSLNRQTLHKMMAASSALAPNRLITIENDFDAEFFDPGRVYFLNIQKLSATATLSKSHIDRRTWSLWETIANTVTQHPNGFSVIVDEAHRGMSSNHTARKARETIVSQIIGGGSTGRPAVPVVWGISATPRRFIAAMTDLERSAKAHTVRVDDVRESGLLKDQIILGHTRGVDAAESTLVRHAVRRAKEYEQKWSTYTAANNEPHVFPVLVIQVADKPSERDLTAVVGVVLDEWSDLRIENIVHVFGDHSAIRMGSTCVSWCPPEDIQERSEVRVVLCKTAITTGWDCPRAEVLLSLRVARDIDSITQVMGRIVRTPLARRIHTDEDLNSVHCILPKFDQDAVDAIAEKFRLGDEDSFISGTNVITRPAALARNPHLGQVTLVEVDSFEVDEQKSSAFVQYCPAESILQSDANALQASPASDTSGNVKSNTDAILEEGIFDSSSGIQNLTLSGPSNIFDLVAGLPSYTIPRRTLRSPITRLTSLALLLATTSDGATIDAYAPAKARNQLFSVLDSWKNDLVVAGKLDILLERTRSTRLFERSIAFGNGARKAKESTTTIALDSRGIEILMDKTRAILPEGLANAYVNRLAVKDEDVADAMVATIALASEPSLPAELDRRASQLVEDWFNRYGSAITRLSAAEQERFDRIRRESDRPLLTTITIPVRRTDDAYGDVWDRHLLSDMDGNFRANLKDWESHVLRTELKNGAVAWYRNPASGRHSLQIPYQTTLGVVGLAPDFIFVNRIRGSLVASLIDPHGTHLADAVLKLKGLAAYAERHAARYQRIQSVAKIDNEYCMLNHCDQAVRQAIHDTQASNAEELFRCYGMNY